LQNSIDKKLEDADLICLMISKNFLASRACMREKDKAKIYKNQKGVQVVPIILSACAWLEDDSINKLLAIPTDGQPINSYNNKDDGWLDVIGSINKYCSSINQILNIKVKTEFESFLENTDLLSKSHSEKETLLMKDIFVYPKLIYYDKTDNANKFDSEKFVTDVLQFNKMIISGEKQSGKTTLCKALFYIYRNLNYLPVYLKDDKKHIGNPLNKLKQAFLEQYDTDLFDEIENEKIVPIVDNFHLLKYQEKHIEQYNRFPNQVFIVDDIFDLDIKNQALIQEYKKFIIQEFSATDRNELIKKWVQLKEYNHIQTNQNFMLQSIDEKTERVEQALGLAFGRGIMPSYPFFVLALLSAYETQKPLDNDVTSQGYCYQALIYMYLRKEGVKNDQIDFYINFLTELAFWMFSNNRYSLIQDEFKCFLDFYESKFNLPISIMEITAILSNVNICKYDSFNNYSFAYAYIYYFFVARYLSENIDENKELINKIFINLHKDENAYITIFISHHTKSNYILEQLLLNAEKLFEQHKPATLSNHDLCFFDKRIEQIVKVALPNYNHNPTVERNKILAEKSNDEDIEREKLAYEEEVEDENESELTRNLRLSIKTVEVLGLVIKNRAGSLELKKLENIFEQGLNVHLRVLTSFLELIKDEQSEQSIIKYLFEKLNKLTTNSSRNDVFDLEQKRNLVKKIYWNYNFSILHGILTKSIHSLGSNNLLKIADAVSEKVNNPAVFIVNQGIKMWYGKNVEIDKITKRFSQKDFSTTAKELMKVKIVEHCMLHKIEYKKKQEIESKLKIPIKRT